MGPSRRRGWRRRCCVILATFLLLALVLQVGMGLVVTRRWSDVLDPAYHEKLSRLRRLAAAAPPGAFRVLGLGTSRMEFGLHAEALAEELGRPACCFNLALPGAGPVRNLINLRRVLADGFRPDLVLVEVMPPLFAKDNPFLDITEGILPTTSLRYDELDLLDRYGDRPGLRWQWAKSVLTAWHYHRFDIVKKLAPRLLPKHEARATQQPRCIHPVRQARLDGPDGSFHLDPGQYKEADRTRAREAVRAFFEPKLSQFDPDCVACRSLHGLLALCRERALPAVLLIMPEGPTFRAWYPDEYEIAFRRFVTDLSEEFGAPLVNARAWVGEDGFLDSQHLYGPAADEFSRRLAREELAPLLQTPGRLTAGRR